MNYCDYCDCEDCVKGTKYIFHAQTSDGRWICDVCYTYDSCIRAKRKNNEEARLPCDDKNCIHRPVLISDWSK